MAAGPVPPVERPTVLARIVMLIDPPEFTGGVMPMRNRLCGFVDTEVGVLVNVPTFSAIAVFGNVVISSLKTISVVNTPFTGCTCGGMNVAESSARVSIVITPESIGADGHESPPVLMMLFAFRRSFNVPLAFLCGRTTMRYCLPAGVTDVTALMLITLAFAVCVVSTTSTSSEANPVIPFPNTPLSLIHI